MNENKLVQIADILPPSMPVAVSTNTDMSIPLFALMFFIFVATLFFLQSRKQRLQRIRLRYQRNKINNRQCAFEVSALLQRVGADENRIDNVSWKTYTLMLQKACYSRDSLDGDAMKQLLDQTRQWL